MTTDEVPNFRGGHTVTLAFVLGPLLSACVVLGGIIWAMAKQPEPGEFRALRDRTERVDQNVAVLGARVEAIQATDAKRDSWQQRIETQLDKLVERQRR